MLPLLETKICLVKDNVKSNGCWRDCIQLNIVISIGTLAQYFGVTNSSNYLICLLHNDNPIKLQYSELFSNFFFEMQIGCIPPEKREKN